MVVVSAPSGTGKTTVCEKLLTEMPDMCRSISLTTRRPREGERNGQHYYFVTPGRFQAERERGRFVESAEVHGYLYGTPRDFLEKQIEAGKDTMLVIDVQGARAIRQCFPEAVLIFLLPPSLTELKRRLKARSCDSKEDIGVRLKSAAAEFSCYRAYDYLVVNENVAEAVDSLKAIVAAERCRSSRLRPEPPRSIK
ncbi:MAG: guanylate kinase [Candidatus Hydrogenedentota bacterium]|nr:MAG: guanylate kinase [Candidatus Hydrogenedentota bacterium]